MNDLDKLTERIVAFRDARNWKQFHNPKDLAISLMLEAGEVVEHFQWKNAEEMAKHVAEKKDAVSEELADVLYYLLLMARDLDIDLEAALARKMDINEAKYPVDKSKGNHKKYTEL